MAEPRDHAGDIAPIVVQQFSPRPGFVISYHFGIEVVKTHSNESIEDGTKVRKSAAATR